MSVMHAFSYLYRGIVESVNGAGKNIMSKFAANLSMDKFDMTLIGMINLDQTFHKIISIKILSLPN